MKKAITDLDGVELDYAVAIARGWHAKISGVMCMVRTVDCDVGAWRTWAPTVRWHDAGEVIDMCSFVLLERLNEKMCSLTVNNESNCHLAIGGDGPGIRVSILRGFAISKLGTHVDIPGSTCTNC